MSLRKSTFHDPTRFQVRDAGTPYPRIKNQNLFGNNMLFMGSRIAQEIIFGLFPFLRKMILTRGGGGASFP